MPVICPKCHSRAQSRGDDIYCKDCDRWFKKSSGESKEIIREKNFIQIICASKRIISEEELIKEFGIDTQVWEIERVRAKTTEAYRKDKQVDWTVIDGKVVDGEVHDSGKMLIVPLYHLEVSFRRKIQEDRTRLAIEEMKQEAKKYLSPKKVKPLKRLSGLTLEIDFPDLHFGKLAWEQESGANYDIKIASEMIRSVVARLLSFSKGQNVTRLLLPIGNDFFNSNSKDEETAHGTPQSEDTRWIKTFQMGRQLATDLIDTMTQIAPVDVLIVPGNHDEESAFYLGDSLECWYHNSPQTIINNTPKKRKYYSFGKNLIGFTHGYWEKLDRLPMLMPIEEPLAWSQSKHREWHLGHIHKKRELEFKTVDETGVTIRYLRSLTAADVWLFDNGFVGGQRSAEAFLWHPEEGLIAQYHAMA